MATTVYNTLRNPSNDVVEAVVEVRLIASVTYPWNGAYRDDEAEVIGSWVYGTDESGYWEASLESNDDVLPAGTYYEVIQRYSPGNRTSKTWIAVPASGGPYWIGDLVIQNPDAIDRYIRAAEVVVVPTGGVTSTNVQDALVELQQEIVSGTGDAYYYHDQTIPATTWTINHALGKYPSVSVTTSSGDKVEGEVSYVDANTVTVTFTAAFSGHAHLN